MEKVSVVVLWSLIVVSGMVLGGSVFERLCLSPLWAGAPPESVTSWTLGVIQRPFFQAVVPLWTLLAVAAAALSPAMPSAARPWARAIAVVAVLVFVSTIAFFVPILEKTQANRGAGLPPEEITRLARQFVNWSLLRTIGVAGTCLAAIRALILASR